MVIDKVGVGVGDGAATTVSVTGILKGEPAKPPIMVIVVV